MRTAQTVSRSVNTACWIRFATVSIAVAEVNDPPTAVAVKAAVEDTPLTRPIVWRPMIRWTANEQPEFDSDGGHRQCAGGTVSLAEEHYLHAAANFNGTDSHHTVTDNGTSNGVADPKSTTGTVTATVGAVNDAPTAAADSQTAAEDTPLTFAANGLAANDSPGPVDESSQSLTVTAVSSSSAQGGSLNLGGGNITYTPTANFNGTDSFTYTVTDSGTSNGVADPKTATGTVTVTVTSVNDPPSVDAIANPASVNEDREQTVNLSGIRRARREPTAATATRATL